MWIPNSTSDSMDRREFLEVGGLIIPSLSFAADTASGLLPAGVTANWELANAYRETTPTRERICLNGLWRWRPAKDKAEAVPTGEWGYFKVPGFWPGHAGYLQDDCQTLHVHPSWKGVDLGGTAAAWYQREIAIPAEWTGRQIHLAAEYVNSFAIVFVDGKKVGEIRFPAGDADLTTACQTRRQVPDHATRRGDAAQGCSTFLCRQ